MKKAILKALLAVLTVAAPVLARADLIYYEGFNYPDGAVITNTTLWTKNGGSGGSAVPPDAIVANHQLQVATGGSPISRQDDIHRYFSITNGSPYTNSVQVLYASFTVICTNLPNGP